VNRRRGDVEKKEIGADHLLPLLLQASTPPVHFRFASLAERIGRDAPDDVERAAARLEAASSRMTRRIN
jgi:hypothetical protein